MSSPAKSQESLRILITNWILDKPGGTPLYVRELATALMARGHRPVVYSRIQGPMAHQIRLAAIPVVSELSQIGAAPDIIHGHHHIETMSALLRFRGVPAVYVCHGPLPMQEAPPRSPRVLRYLAVSKAARDRLILGHGVPENKVEITPSFVDLSRFRPRDPLPERPRRALAFGNHFHENQGLREIREACQRAALPLDVIGTGVDQVDEHPETLLRNYDIVFAKARCALEAMAVGCAVVLCSYEGVGPSVCRDNVHELHLRNFGAGALTETLSADILCERIRDYDAGEATEVSRLIRASADIKTVVAQLEGVYRGVLAEWEKRPPADLGEEMNAASDYLQEWAPTFYSWALAKRFEEMEQEVTDLRARLNDMHESATWRWTQGFLRLPVVRNLVTLVRR